MKLLPWKTTRIDRKPDRSSSPLGRRPRWLQTRDIAAAAAAAVVTVSACASSVPVEPLEGERLEASRAHRVQALRAAIAEDHATLQRRVSEERGELAPPLYVDSEIRAIARRLGPHEEELARLLSTQPTGDPAKAFR